MAFFILIGEYLMIFFFTNLRSNSSSFRKLNICVLVEPIFLSYTPCLTDINTKFTNACRAEAGQFFRVKFKTTCYKVKIGRQKYRAGAYFDD